MRTILGQYSDCDSSLRAVGGGGLHWRKNNATGQRSEAPSAPRFSGDLQSDVQDPLVLTS